MTEKRSFTPKEVLKQYYGNEKLYEKYSGEADEILSQMDHKKGMFICS